MNRQEHLLSCLAEECCEVGQRVSKALRFGLGEVQSGQPLTNAERIVEELADLWGVALMLADEGALPAASLWPTGKQQEDKRAKIEKFMAKPRARSVVMTTPGAPMEARAREVLASHLTGVAPMGRDLFGRAIAAMIEFATAPTPAAEEVDGLPGDLLRKRIAEGYPVPAKRIDQCEHGRFGWEDCIACYDIELEETAAEIDAKFAAPSTQLQPGGAGFNETADPLKVAEEMRERCAVFLERHADAIMAHVGGVVGALVGPQVAQLLRTDATAIRALPLTGAGDGGEEG